VKPCMRDECIENEVDLEREGQLFDEIRDYAVYVASHKESHPAVAQSYAAFVRWLDVRRRCCDEGKAMGIQEGVAVQIVRCP
jgi:hypothetical protein